DVLQVDANLVRPSRLQPKFQARVPGKPFDNLKMGHGRFPAGGDGHQFAVVEVTADWRVDPTGVMDNHAVDQRLVNAGHEFFLKLHADAAVGVVGFAGDEQPG